MHSSRMRTAHLFTVSCSIAGGGGVSKHAAGRGVSAWGIYPGGVFPGVSDQGVCQGVSVQGGVCPGGCLPKGGVCLGGVCPRRVSASCPGVCVCRHPLYGQTDTVIS